jgi:hypothetical protein
MNRTEPILRRLSFMTRLIKCLLLCGGVVFLLARPALAADASYINFGTVNYPATTNSVPNIDATNFVNLGSFIIDFITVPISPSLYETHDTLNYTNSGTMDCNTGFLLDNASSSSNFRTLAASVNNSGTIECAPGTDQNSFFGLGGFNASATNIISPGTVDVGEGGLMVFNGQNVDLSSGTMIMEGPGDTASGTGSFGTNIWDPGQLTATSATSGPLGFPLLDLTNSTPFIQLVTSGSNNIYRAVFIQDDSPSNVSYSVFFGNVDNFNLGFGDVTIQ